MTIKIPIENQRGIEMLEDFGLSHNEALIYTYLLRRGIEVGGSKIALGTGIHRQYVYKGIEKLMKLLLVEAVTHGKQSRYKAISQTQIERIAKKRVLQAGEIVRELNTFSLFGHEQFFEIYQGEAQLQDFEIDFAHSLSQNETQYVIGGAAGDFYNLMDGRYKEFVSIIQKKDLTTLYLGPEEELAVMKKANAVEPNFVYRTFKGFPASVMNTVIRKDSVAIYSFAKPPLVYVIRSEAVAEHYKRFFMMLWNLAGDTPKQL